MRNNKNVLVCITGLTPQIVTEALYCFSVQKKSRINELYIITTARGGDVILGKDKARNTPDVQLKTEIEKMCKKYKIHLPAFKNSAKHIICAKEETVELPDIRTDKHNRLFPNKVAAFLKEKTSEQNTTLHCVLTGGRKSMSAHLALALSLFGRTNDKLYHILTYEEFEFKGFYPSDKKEDKALVIAEIPYVRLRSLIPAEIRQNKTYTQLVNYAQKRLELISDERLIILNNRLREILFDGNKIKIQPLDYAIYIKFVERNIECKTKISIHKIISKEFALEIKQFIDENYPHYYYREDIRNPWWKKGFEDRNFRSKRSKINSELKVLFNDDDTAEEFCISSVKIYGESSYYIKADPKKFKIEY